MAIMLLLCMSIYIKYYLHVHKHQPSMCMIDFAWHCIGMELSSTVNCIVSSTSTQSHVLNKQCESLLQCTYIGRIDLKLQLKVLGYLENF